MVLIRLVLEDGIGGDIFLFLLVLVGFGGVSFLFRSLSGSVTMTVCSCGHDRELVFRGL